MILFVDDVDIEDNDVHSNSNQLIITMMITIIHNTTTTYELSVVLFFIF